jgi:hypothetical protein
MADCAEWSIRGMGRVLTIPLIAVALGGCSRVSFGGDPGVTFRLTNGCATDVEVDVRLATDAPEDWRRLAPNETVRLAHVDAPISEFELHVRAVDDPSTETFTTPADDVVTVSGHLCSD